MTKTEEYFLDVAKTIEKECLEKGISVRKWIERYAEKYCRRFSNGRMQKISEQKEDEL